MQFVNSKFFRNVDYVVLSNNDLRERCVAKFKVVQVSQPERAQQISSKMLHLFFGVASYPFALNRIRVILVLPCAITFFCCEIEQKQQRAALYTDIEERFRMKKCISLKKLQVSYRDSCYWKHGGPSVSLRKGISVELTKQRLPGKVTF